jgi:hypothetical protein
VNGERERIWFKGYFVEKAMVLDGLVLYNDRQIYRVYIIG